MRHSIIIVSSIPCSILQKDHIQTLCSSICKDCIAEIAKVTQVIKTQLVPFSDALNKIWSLRKRATDVLETCSGLNQLLVDVAQERSVILRSLSTVSLVVCNSKKIKAVGIEHYCTRQEDSSISCYSFTSSHTTTNMAAPIHWRCLSPTNQSAVGRSCYSRQP